MMFYYSIYSIINKNILIPDGIKKIPSCAFEDCTSLTDVIMPNNIKKIKTSAFRGCSSIQNINNRSY